MGYEQASAGSDYDSQMLARARRTTPAGKQDAGETNPNDPTTSQVVRDEEYRLIRMRRIRAFAPTASTGPAEELPPITSGKQSPEYERELIGLAFSGGGIRSATFGLGILQGLAKLKLLKGFDYLSTVSGGGYIGSWFAAWVKREGDIANVEQQLIPRRAEQALAQRGFESLNSFNPPGQSSSHEPQAVKHLREYSNYLAPRAQLLSSDTWTLIAIYLRNLLANQLVLIPFACAAVLAIRGYAGIWPVPSWLGNLAGVTGLSLLLLVFVMIAWSLNGLTRRWPRTDDAGENIYGRPDSPRWLNSTLWLSAIAALLLTWALLPSGKIEKWTGDEAVRFPAWKFFSGRELTGLKTFDLADLVLFAVLFAGLHGFVGRGRIYRRWRPIFVDLAIVTATGVAWWWWYEDRSWGVNWKWFTADWWKESGAAIGRSLVAALLGGTLLNIVLGAIWDRSRIALGCDRSWTAEARQRHGADRLRHGSCAVASGAVGGTLLYFALNQVLWRDGVSMGAIVTFGPPLLLLSFVLAAMVEIALLGRSTTEQEREWWSRLIAWQLILILGWTVVCGLCLYGPLWIKQLSASAQSGLLVGWVGTTLVTLKAAGSSKTGSGTSLSLFEWICVIGPYLFLAGLICLISLTADQMLTAKDKVLATAAEVAADRVSPAVDPPEEFRETEVVVESRSTDGGSRLKSTVVRTTAVLRPDYLERVAQRHWIGVCQTNWTRWWWALGICLGVAGLASYCVDVNRFSLNALYANRLTACYLGASRPVRFNDQATEALGASTHSHGRVRAPHPVTGFDPADEFDLTDLQPMAVGTSRAGTVRTAATPERIQSVQTPVEDVRTIPYPGPYYLINTALNLVAGEQLAWQERMAESFILSPLYCGCHSLGFRKSEEYAARMKLGRAISISGAAANPNMGYHSSPAVTALLTLFNVRLGWWVPNPQQADAWRTNGPSFLLRWLGCEVFGLTNSRTKFLNISDGGHFENLGVYELVRRRCRCIIVSDAGADPKFQFEDLAGLIRKCRTDFGVAIEIDITPLKPNPQTGLAAAHCVVGTIRYDMVDPTAPVGLLLYLKPTLTGDEPEDVRQYKTKYAAFPHQPTLDQFFSESQFECYRELGYHTVIQALGEIAGGLPPFPNQNLPSPPPAQPMTLPQADSVAFELHRDFAENLVWELRKYWLPEAPTVTAGFNRPAVAYARLQAAIQGSETLQRFMLEIYPELAPLLPDDAAGFIGALDEAGLIRALEAAPAHPEAPPPGALPPEVNVSSADHAFVAQLLQLMENTWLDVHLDQHPAHPLNSGWMNLFRRWSQHPKLRLLWPLMRQEFSQEFVRFCERELSLHEGRWQVVTRDDVNDAEWTRLCEELQAECDARDRPETRKDAPAVHTEDAGSILSDWRPDQIGPDLRQQFWAVRVEFGQPVQGQVGTPVSFIAGIAGLRPLTANLKPATLPGVAPFDKTDAWEFCVWVRPGFRQRGFGAFLVQTLLSRKHGTKIDRGDRERVRIDSLRLLVRHPVRVWRDQPGGLGKAGWMSFFSFYGFRPVKSGLMYDARYQWMERSNDESLEA
jgi:GNAT superfamily N-acetyltransferase